MTFTRRSVTTASLLGAPALFAVQRAGLAQISEMPPPSRTETQQIAIDAYVYGYSLMTAEVTRVQMSNVAEAEGLHAPTGQFINMKRYPSAKYRAVSAPNADTLYSLGWLDLSEPQVFSYPDMGDRYFLFEMTDLWMTDFASPGTRTAGGKAGTYLITGPGWTGEVPGGMTQIKCATRYMVILGRTYADGSERDYEAVNALQAQYRIVPLSRYGQPFTYKAPPVDPKPGFSMTAKPQTVLLDMPIETYFGMMAKLMAGAAPPSPDDAPMLASMARIGVVPGRPFDMSGLPLREREALKQVPRLALREIEDHRNMLGTMVKGWVITKGLGVYGTNYMKRAVVAAFGWPANLQDDAVYPYTEVDSEGRTLSGANKYQITFAKDGLPPVNGFWSITMYEIDKGWWFVPNPLNRFTVSMRNKPTTNPDGSLTLLFQTTSPGADREANWLPAPKGNFILMLRMYWPKTENPSMIDGTWTPPSVQRV